MSVWRICGGAVGGPAGQVGGGPPGLLGSDGGGGESISAVSSLTSEKTALKDVRE